MVDASIVNLIATFKMAVVKDMFWAFIFIVLLQADFVHGQLLKKQYFQIAATHIKHKGFFSQKELRWDQIRTVREIIGRASYLEIFGRQEIGKGFSGVDVTIKLLFIKYDVSEQAFSKTLSKMRCPDQKSEK